MARPTKQPHEKLRPVSIQQGVLAVLDNYIRGVLADAHQAGVSDDLPTQEAIEARRADFIESMILAQYGLDSKYPIKVEMIVPVNGAGWHSTEVAEWVENEERRLNEQAPELVKASIQLNKHLHAAEVAYRGYKDIPGDLGDD